MVMQQAELHYKTSAWTCQRWYVWKHDDSFAQDGLQAEWLELLVGSNDVESEKADRVANKV